MTRHRHRDGRRAFGSHRKIPVAHFEANFKIACVFAALYFEPTETAVESLRRANVAPETIHFTINLVICARHWVTAKIE